MSGQKRAAAPADDARPSIIPVTVGSVSWPISGPRPPHSGWIRKREDARVLQRSTEAFKMAPGAEGQMSCVRRLKADRRLEVSAVLRTVDLAAEARSQLLAESQVQSPSRAILTRPIRRAQQYRSRHQK